MAHYEDLSQYNYHHSCEKELNVGWLQKGQPFSVGEIPSGFLDKLKAYTEDEFIVFRTRGFHRCEFCDDSTYSSNEIRIVSNNGIAYACPMLIIHYIEKHNYLPPQEFIYAVMNGPVPGSKEYNDIVKRLPEIWERRKPDLNDEDYEEKMRQVMVDDMAKSIDQQIIDDILNESPEFKKFVEAYNKIMPSVYNVGFKNQKS